MYPSSPPTTTPAAPPTAAPNPDAPNPDAPNPDAEAFIRSNTVVATPSLLPEVKAWMATEVTTLWRATEEELEAANLPPPYWAFAWPGGQAVARHVLDAPGLVAGRRVMDFAAGGGVAAVAAALAGAAHVVAVEIDPFAVAAIRLNAALNGVTVEAFRGDIVGRPPEDTVGPVDVILAGDVCYERPMAEGVLAWLRGLVARGTTVLIGDPGRSYRPRDGVIALSTHTVPTSTDLEDRETRETVVWRLEG